MNIQSQYYDVIDYLKDHNDNRTFNRKEYTCCMFIDDWKTNPIKLQIRKDTNARPLAYQVNTYANSMAYSKDKNKSKDDCKKLEMDAYFHFIPTNTKIPLKIYINPYTDIKRDAFIIKEGTELCNNFPSIPEDHVNKTMFDFFNGEEFKVGNPDFSIKPTWYISGRVYNGETKCYWNSQFTYIWIHPPLAMIPNLLNYFSNYEEIFQQVETYLWSDVELKDPMKNIGNKDRIIGHGFDLKTSFRKEKTK